ncbi:MAG: hypothetical protein LUE22_06905 [Oscillospiraceae bacterium]|nr:hypothetical protein [Oscillospiraceae bacterium]
MKIEFNDEQLALLKEVVAEYAEITYHDMFDYKRVAVDAEEDFVKEEYNALADQEEERFRQVKALSEYIVKYEELMGHA